MLSMVSAISHAEHPSGCVIVHQKPESRGVNLFDTIEKCRAEVEKLMQANSQWAGYIDDASNKLSIEMYFPRMPGIPIFINR